MYDVDMDIDYLRECGVFEYGDGLDYYRWCNESEDDDER